MQIGVGALTTTVKVNTAFAGCPLPMGAPILAVWMMRASVQERLIWARERLDE